MGSNRSEKSIAAVALVLIVGFALWWAMERPGRDAWNYSVATSIAEYYHDTGFLPKSQDALVANLETADVDHGFLSALEKMKIRKISDEDFFSGDDLIELPDNPKNQKFLNNFIRNACAADMRRK